MPRPSAHRTWIAYKAVEAFAFGLGWTVAPVLFVRELGFSPLELVLAGTALEVAYFAFEIPTGIVADTYGRRLSIIAGVAGLGVGFVATGLANGVWLVLGAAAFMGFTWTFKSGADEAWVTDEVGVESAGARFRQARRRRASARWLGIGAAVALALVDLRLPIVAGGVVMLGLRSRWRSSCARRVSSPPAPRASLRQPRWWAPPAGRDADPAQPPAPVHRRHRVLPRRVGRGLRPAVGGALPRRRRRARLRRARLRWSGSACSLRARWCWRSSSRNRSRAACPS